MSDANRVTTRYLKETTWGTTPSAAMTNLRITGESLGQRTGRAASQELRADRAIPRGSRVDLNAEGGINFELSYGNLDGLLEGLCMQSSWPTVADVTATTISASDTDNSINDSGSGFGSFVAGQWVKVSGFTESANNGWFRVETAAAGKLTLAGATLVTEAAGDSVTVEGSRIKGNGTTKVSFSMEKEFADITEFINFVGMRVSTFDLNIAPGQLITGSMGFLGKQADAVGATIGTGAANTAPTNDVMNAVDNVKRVLEGGVGITGVVGFAFSVANNLRPQPELAVLGGNDIALGSNVVSGSLDRYFASRAQYEKYLDNTETDLGVAMEDADGNGYAFSFPGVDYDDSQVLAEGINGDVISRFQWSAHLDATFDEMWSITRVAA